MDHSALAARVDGTIHNGTGRPSPVDACLPRGVSMVYPSFVLGLWANLALGKVPFRIQCNSQEIILRC